MKPHKLEITGGPLPRRLQSKIKKYNFVFFNLAGLLVLGVFFIATLVSQGLFFGDRLFHTATSGVSALESAKSSLASQDYQKANSQLQEALNFFSNGSQQLNNLSGSLGLIANLLPQKEDAENLFNAAKLLTEAGILANASLSQLADFKITPSGLYISDANQLNRLENNFAQISIKTKQALDDLNKVNTSLLPAEQKQKIETAKVLLSAGQPGLDALSSLSKAWADIFAGQHTVLFVFQNNNELRPTGGFIGSFGSVYLTNGTIKGIKISSVYDLDGQLKQVIAPPLPIRAVNTRWYLRDSNWFFDFPTTAKKINQFYALETGEFADLIIALNPEVIAKILSITGPIAMPSYNTQLNQDNFVETVQQLTSIDYDKKLNKPKQLLADLFPVLMQRIAELKQQQQLEIFQLLINQISQKNLQFYATSEKLQNSFKDNGWSGQVLGTSKDYLAVVSANLGGTKTDQKIHEAWNLETQVGSFGDVTNTLTITRSNLSAGGSSATNKSFIKIYVPKGSKLIDNNGFSKDPVIGTPLLKDAAPDADVAIIENSSFLDPSGTSIFTESDKTVFGNWLETGPNETKTVTIKYKLPFKLKGLEAYSLLVQKQSGVDRSFKQIVKLNSGKVDWILPDTYSLQDKNLVWNLDLNQDYFAGFVYEN